MKKENTFKEWLPGLLLSLIIAIVARGIEAILPVDFIGATVIAIFLGILINYFYSIKGSPFEQGIQFTSKRVLKFAIVLLGGSLSIATILEVGQITLFVLMFTLLAAFGGGFLLGKLLGLDWKFTSLMSSGVGICGGSAISAVAPIIEAEDHKISYAMSNVFIFDMLLILLFPIIGQLLNLSDLSFGLWAGTAINDTSSVVAASYAYSEAAGDFATMVKLTRTLAIIPVVIIFAMIQLRKKRQATMNNQTDQVEMNLMQVFPWFIVWFLAFVLANSIGLIPLAVSESLKEASKFLMVVALAAIGLKTNVGAMIASGFKPMLHGVLTSILVIFVSLGAQLLLGMV